MNSSFKERYIKFAPAVITIFASVIVAFCLVACALQAQRKKNNNQRTEPITAVDKDIPPIEASGARKVTVSVKEFEYNDTTYLLIEKEGSNSFSVILK
jgi:hypothetical protein